MKEVASINFGSIEMDGSLDEVYMLSSSSALGPQILYVCMHVVWERQTG